MLTDIKEVIEKLDKELLDVPLDFIGMEKGTLSYKGMWREKGVYCTVSESEVASLYYERTENIRSLIEGEYVYVSCGGVGIISLG